MAKRKRFFDDDFFDENILDAMREMMEELSRGPLFRGGLKPGKSSIQGVHITVGPDGKPRMQRFGNAPQQKNVFEPWVDVIDGDDKVTVVAELQGVDKKELELNAARDLLTIRVANPEHPIRKTVKLPAEVKSKTARATLKNGLLEVILEKKSKRKKGTKIRVS